MSLREVEYIIQPLNFHVIYLKKENYIAPEKIPIWLHNLQEYFSSKRQIEFDCKHVALLVIDMQRFFLDSDSHAFIPTSVNIIEPIKKLVELFYKKRLPVIFIKYGLSKQDRKNSAMDKWWADILSLSDPLSAIHPTFAIKTPYILSKPSYDPFYKSNFEEILRKEKVTQVVISGVHTHLCVETTARNAFSRGYTVWLPIDCLATYNEELHLGSLRAAAHCFGIPTTSALILEELKKS